MVGPIGTRRLLRGTAVIAAAATMSGFDAPGALAGTFAVNSTADTALGGAVTCLNGATCTLRAAIQAADASGGANTVTLPAGEYRLTIAPPSGTPGSDPEDPASGDLDIEHGTTVTLSGSGAATTVIDANGIDRAFTVHTGASLNLSALSVNSGSPAVASDGDQEGGAVYADGGLSTDNVDFTASSSPADGGAIYADTNSRLSVDNTVFTGDTSAYGGAIEDASSNPAAIANTAFDRESASSGGGDIYFSGSGALTVSNSNFMNTVGDGGGGAIYAAGGGQVAISGSQFTGDSSSYGGAIFSSGSISLSGDDFTDDAATGSSAGTGGGALYMDGSGSTQTLVEDQFSGDSASVYGGAIYTGDGTLAIAQSSIVGSESEYGAAAYLGGVSALFEDDTIAQNSAILGGALYLSAPAPLTLVNDTLDANTATQGGGGGIFGAAAASAGSGAGIVNTIIADNVGGDCDAGLAGSLVTGFDLDSDASCFGGLTAPGLQPGVQPELSPPANNGGQVLTMLELADSPTIGTGDSAYCPAADARSVERNPASCDLGAYQAISTGLSASNTAPVSAPADGTFVITLTATNTGPGIASNLIVSDQLPAATTLSGAQPSAGTCSVSGTPAKLTCDLGTVAGGASASVSLFVSSGEAGTFLNSATISDDQGATASATAQTAIIDTAAEPTISRAQIRGITRTAATLRAGLDPQGNAVSYFFQYGTRRTFQRVTRVSVTSAPGIRSARVVGLVAGKRYYFRLVATSGAEVSLGPTYSFVTKPAKRKPTRKRRRSAPPPRS